MAYQIHRNNKIVETLELYNYRGDLATTINVDLSIDGMSGRLGKAYDALGAAQNNLKRNPSDTEAFGTAVLNVFTVIFGEEGTQRILEFYDGNYSEMLLGVFPFINDVIMPKIKEASAQRKKQLLSAAKKMR